MREHKFSFNASATGRGTAELDGIPLNTRSFSVVVENGYPTVVHLELVNVAVDGLAYAPRKEGADDREVTK